MRLLNTQTFQHEEFFNKAPPRYAILSHTWGPEEVLYEKMVQKDFAKSSYPVGVLFETAFGIYRLIRVASSNVNSTDNTLQYRWHLPPYAAADNLAIE